MGTVKTIFLTIFLIVLTTIILATGTFIFLCLNDETAHMTPYVFQAGAASSVDIKPPEVTKSEEDEEQKLRQILRAKIEYALENANKRNEQIVKDAQQEIAFIAENNADTATRNIPSVLDELTSLKECARLCYLIAKDKLNGSTETERHIQQVLERHIIIHIVQGSQKVQNVLARLDDRFAQNHTEMTIELAAATDGVFTSFEPAFKERFSDFIREIHTQTLSSSSKISVTTITSSFGLALDALFLKSAASASKRVLDAIASKIIKTAAASLASAAADGPIPVGDIIGFVAFVGGSAWSAYDLHKAQVTLKTDLANSLNTSIQEFKTRTMSDSLADIEKIARAHEEKNREVAGELLAKL